MSLSVGLVFLAVLWYIDMQKEHTLASPFAMASSVAIGAGAFGTISHDNFGRGLLALVVGAAAVYVGSLQARRATTWTGGAAIVAGVWAMVDSFFDPPDMDNIPAMALGRGAGALLVLFGLIVIGAGAFKSLAADGVMDQIKAKQASLANQGESTDTEAASYTGAVGDGVAGASTTQPADWYPDPSSRNELRYFDGTNWTEHISNAGERGIDPPV